MAGPLLHQVTVDAPAQRIFDAITTSRGLRGFWVPASNAEASEGTVATFDFGPEAHLEMRIDELQPGRLVRWTCLGDFPGWAGTKVAWEISPGENGGMSVLFRHEGWPPAMPPEDLASVNYTWGGIMGRLKQHVETGEAVPFLG